MTSSAPPGCLCPQLDSAAKLDSSSTAHSSMSYYGSYYDRYGYDPNDFDDGSEAESVVSDAPHMHVSSSPWALSARQSCEQVRRIAQRLLCCRTRDFAPT